MTKIYLLVLQVLEIFLTLVKLKVLLPAEEPLLLGVLEVDPLGADEALEPDDALEAELADVPLTSTSLFTLELSFEVSPSS